ncbi:hypothetical protein [Tabrizicola sp. YIM 78059]|uniref:hypothetical protein n=1 Tax=Tabrizicola sp. YIM 78059 TaxID=2529861 RepID=UPI00145B9E36|nr:hypothetical protein [Tabrizicola sp. YIM 78059]
MISGVWTGSIETFACDLAGDGPLLPVLISGALAEATRGRIGGSNRHVVRIGPPRHDIWRIPFAGQARAEVGAFGDGMGALVWKVTDAEGFPICMDILSEGPLHCGFDLPEDALHFGTVIAG